MTFYDEQRRRSDDYRAGLKDMAQWLAVWHDGQQEVGVVKTPLAQVMAEIDMGRWDGGRQPTEESRDEA